MHISSQSVSCKSANGAENHCFAVIAILLNECCHEFPDGTDISLYRSNESFREGQFEMNSLIARF
jgi:hypothetical protein